MTMLYILMAMLTAGVCIKLVYVLSPRGGNSRVTRADRFLVGIITLVLPAAALALYLLMGRPDLKSQQAIFDMSADLATRQAALLARKPMNVLVEQNPDDIGAHVSLAEINQRIGRYEDEIKFMARAVALAAAVDDPYLRNYAVALGQAQVRASKGIVGDDALETFAFVRSLFPESPLARHYETLAIAQRGDPARAIALWRPMLAEGPTRAYWKDMVRKAIADTERGMRSSTDKKEKTTGIVPAVSGGDIAVPASQ